MDMDTDMDPTSASSRTQAWAASIGRQASFSRGYSPLYATILDCVAGWLRESEGRDARVSLLRQRFWTFISSRTWDNDLEPILKLAATLHSHVLRGDPRVAGLRPYYRTVTPDGPMPDEPAFAGELLTALDRLGEDLLAQAHDWEIQTNETARGVLWLVPAALLQIEAAYLVELGVSVARIDRRMEDGWQLVPERLAKVLTPRTRAVILTNLHSPSGVACSPRTLAEIAALAARVGAMVLVDEVLLEHAFDLDPAAPCRPACLVADNAISFSSTSKGLGLPELRVGWLVTRDPDAARGLKIAADYLHTRLPAASCGIADHALRHPEEFVPDAVRLSGPGRRVLERWAQGETRVEWVAPLAGMHALLRLPVGVSDLGFASHLRGRYETQVVPGSVLEAPGCVRLCFAAQGPVLEQGLANVSAALDDLQGGPRLEAPPPPRAA